MPPPLEQMLMNQYKLRYREAQDIVQAARQDLGLPPAPSTTRCGVGSVSPELRAQCHKRCLQPGAARPLPPPPSSSSESESESSEPATSPRVHGLSHKTFLMSLASTNANTNSNTINPNKKNIISSNAVTETASDQKACKSPKTKKASSGATGGASKTRRPLVETTTAPCSPKTRSNKAPKSPRPPSPTTTKAKKSVKTTAAAVAAATVVMPSSGTSSVATEPPPRTPGVGGGRRACSVPKARPPAVELYSPKLSTIPAAAANHGGDQVSCSSSSSVASAPVLLQHHRPQHRRASLDMSSSSSHHSSTSNHTSSSKNSSQSSRGSKPIPRPVNQCRLQQAKQIDSTSSSLLGGNFRSCSSDHLAYLLFPPSLGGAATTAAPTTTRENAYKKKRRSDTDTAIASAGVLKRHSISGRVGMESSISFPPWSFLKRDESPLFPGSQRQLSPHSLRRQQIKMSNTTTTTTATTATTRGPKQPYCGKVYPTLGNDDPTETVSLSSSSSNSCLEFAA
ncbi:hypothetical protein ACA910_002242 [Epithemia clementina (nom. ined.)]